MRVVAVGTDHLAFLDRVMRDAVFLSALFLVATETDFGLAGSDQYGVLGRVYSMAGRAGDITPLVLTAAPMRAQTRLVASQAGVGLGLGIHCIFVMATFHPEHDIRMLRRVALVFRAVAMTGLAPGSAAVGGYPVAALINGKYRFCVVGVVTDGTDLVGIDGARHFTTGEVRQRSVGAGQRGEETGNCGEYQHSGQ